MKIYFGSTVVGNRCALDTARHVVELLEEAGHEALTRHLVHDKAWEADRQITPKEIYLRDMNWPRECNLFIAEVSGSSFGIGFETGYLLGSSQKRALLFYRREVEKSISLLITRNNHQNCTLIPYSDSGESENYIAKPLAEGFGILRAAAICGALGSIP
jgi:hypothetical protein